MSAITVLDKSNVPNGPFTRAQVAEKLQSGEFSLDSLAFVEGLTQWTPLRDVLAKVDAPAPPLMPPVPPVAPPAVGTSPSYSYAATMQPPGHVVYAGFWLRFVAYLVDSLIISVPVIFIAVIIGFIFGFVGGLTGALSHSGSSDSSDAMSAVMEIGIAIMEIIIWGATLVIAWLYFAKLESGPAQSTFGKRILGLKVTNLAGERISFGQASGRFFGKIISGMTMYIGFIMAGFTDRKQALHDMLASTLVIKS